MAEPDDGAERRAADLARAATRHREGRLDEAAALYRRVLDAAPEQAGVWHNLGVALAQNGDPQAAVDAFDRAIAARPDYLHAHVNKGGALQTLGRFAAAAEAYGRALALDPSLYEIHVRNALTLLAAGRRDAALGAFGETRKIRQDAAAMGIDHPGFSRTSRLKLGHDAAQFRHLAACGIEARHFSRLADLYERTAAAIDPATADEAPLALVEIAAGGLRESYNRALHDHDAAETGPPALNAALDFNAIQTDYAQSAAGIAVIDGLLSPAALSVLRAHLVKSTIWHDFTHIPGFLAAYLEDGLASPILLQIADELRARLPAVLGPHPLFQAWAFKGLTGDRGIDVHADSGAVSLNLWLTPDRANRDPGAGGLIVHRALPPEDWALSEYDKDIEPIRAFLADSEEGAVTVAYAENRAVLFRSDLFHESGQVRFEPGYENHRVNLTLVFGQRR